MENHTNAATSSSSDSKDPSAFLSEIIGVPVTVKLNSGIVYKGTVDLFLGKFIRADGINRRAPIGGWIYEYCAGEMSGVCQWTIEEELWRRVCEGK